MKYRVEASVRLSVPATITVEAEDEDAAWEKAEAAEDDLWTLDMDSADWDDLDILNVEAVTP